MTWRGWRRVALVAVVAGWVALAVLTARGSDAQEFRESAAQAAQGGLDAVRTAHLAGELALAGRVFRPYLQPVLDNAREDVGTAQRRVAEKSPPGAAERQLSDELRPLLDAADRRLSDLTVAVDQGERPAIAAAAAALAPIGDRLSDFVLRHRS